MAEPEIVPVPVESILFTEQLDLRPSRPPDYQRENQALVRLLQTLTDSPENVLQKLADTILDLLQCGSAGISLLTQNDGGKRFYWPAIAGAWKTYIGGGTPRDFGPCGDVLDRNTPLLFKKIQRRYTYFEPVAPPVEEALLVPFYVGGKATGTLWAVAHDGHEFDAEDRRQLLSLATFAATAYQCVASIDASRHLAAIVKSSDDAIISKDLDGVITTWNRSAERLFGYSAKEAIGQHITLIVPADRRDEEVLILERLRRGEHIDHFETIRQRKDGTTLDISLTISPVKDAAGVVVGASKTARDITEKREAEKARQETEISSRLLQLQDVERRRIARELHDGVGQLMVAVGMNIARIKQEKETLTSTQARCVEENSVLIAQASTEIRAVSYLLHPPMLDEVGLQSALMMYLDGFNQRSKIDIALEIDPSIGRLPQDYELSLFRIAQECLTNIYRHSGSATALIRLSQAAGKIELEVRDTGRGIDKETQARINSGVETGVGFRGMQERVKRIGGILAIRSDESSTSVRAILPIPSVRAA